MVPPDPSRCPLCERPNACAMAAGDTCANCWCTTVVIPAAVLAKVPAAAVGKACVCRACATATPATTPSSPRTPKPPRS